jgi:hypothetical protein
MPIAVHARWALLGMVSRSARPDWDDQQRQTAKAARTMLLMYFIASSLR